jgi:hypothetical protein
MKPIERGSMSTTITLKGIPENVYDQLKSSAEANRRSINSEAIACLETVLLPRKTNALAHLEKAKSIRDSLTPGQFNPEDIDQFKKSGRS